MHNRGYNKNQIQGNEIKVDEMLMKCLCVDLSLILSHIKW